MQRNIMTIMAFVPSAALAHDGFHVHPHGMEYGWIIAVVIGVAVGVVIARAWK
jgi:hypothetical protein